MKSLEDWYKYLDQVSRPVRTGEPAGPAETGWRPWRPSGADEAADDQPPFRLPAIPGLFDLPDEGAASPATAEYEDPTIYDELEPLEAFEAPTLRAPSLMLQPPASSILPPEEPETSPAEADEEGEVDQTQIAEMLSELRRERNGEAPDQAAGRHELLKRAMNQVLTLEETARILNVCPTTVRRYTNRGSLNHFRTPGNQRRFRLVDVLEFLESRPAGSEAGEAT